MHVDGDTYYLRGIAFDERDQRRVVDVRGQTDEQDPQVFCVERYEYVPCAVLTGRLWVKELCKMARDDWLLFGVEQEGQRYTFGLAWNRDKYPELWRRTGGEVTLAGDLVPRQELAGVVLFACAAFLSGSVGRSVVDGLVNFPEALLGRRCCSA